MSPPSQPLALSIADGAPLGTVIPLLLFAYLLGSIPFGLVLAKLRGIDLRTVGSGNIGATNAARALGKAQGALVLLLDAAKGSLPVLLARHYLGARSDGPWVVAAVALAAFVGHLYPVYLRFRGGKGVATALGINLTLAPLACLVGAAVWVTTYRLSRYSSLASLMSAATFPPILWSLKAPPATLALATAMLPLIVWKHRGNIERLWAGKENRVEGVGSGRG